MRERQVPPYGLYSIAPENMTPVDPPAAPRATSAVPSPVVGVWSRAPLSPAADEPFSLGFDGIVIVVDVATA